MADTRWMVTIEGKQLDGDFNADQARDLIAKNSGKPLLVWKPGMAQWADPSTIPELRAAPAATGTPAADAPSKPGKPSPVIDKDEVKKQVGLLKGLLDFRFQTFITTKMIPILYLIVMVLIVLLALGYFFVVGGGGIISGIRFKSGTLILTGLISMLLSPIVAIIYLAMIRMWFEVVLLFFRMKENLDELVAASGKKSLTK